MHALTCGRENVAGYGVVRMQNKTLMVSSVANQNSQQCTSMLSLKEIV